MVCAHWAMSFFPTGVEPVKLRARTVGLWHKASPISRALPVITENTPAGKPARSARTPSASADKGVADAGLTMTGHPAAKAGAAFRVIMELGKFQGVMAAATPIGWRMARGCLPIHGEGMTSPYARRPSSANQSI